MYDLIIKNGLVVSPSSTVKCDVAIQGKKIVGLGTYDEKEDCTDNQRRRKICNAGRY